MLSDTVIVGYYSGLHYYTADGELVDFLATSEVKLITPCSGDAAIPLELHSHGCVLWKVAFKFILHGTLLYLV